MIEKRWEAKCSESTNLTKQWSGLSRDITKPTKWVCAQRRLRSAWASVQSDQSLRCALNGWLRTQVFFMRTAKTLIRLGGCPGWSESSLGAHSFCSFSHVAAQFIITARGHSACNPPGADPEGETNPASRNPASNPDPEYPCPVVASEGSFL